MLEIITLLAAAALPFSTAQNETPEAAASLLSADYCVS
jgi:hypothetical protein